MEQLVRALSDTKQVRVSPWYMTGDEIVPFVSPIVTSQLLIFCINSYVIAFLLLLSAGVHTIWRSATIWSLPPVCRMVRSWDRCTFDNWIPGHAQAHL